MHRSSILIVTGFIIGAATAAPPAPVDNPRPGFVSQPCDDAAAPKSRPVECATADEGESSFAQPADQALRSRLNEAMLGLEREGRLPPFTAVPRIDAASLPEFPAPRPVDSPLACADLYDQLAQATVMIHTGYKCDRCSNWHGGVATGFIVHPDGWIMTAGHVFKDLEANRHLSIMLHDESIHPIESVALIDEEADLAVIKIAATELTFLPIAMDAPAPGVPVSVLSHPNGHYYLLTRGVISRVLDESAPPRDRLQITAPFAIGSSGAPVINDFGNIVGMALSTETIYADPQDQKNPQLVIPTCTPAAAIRAALESN